MSTKTLCSLDSPPPPPIITRRHLSGDDIFAGTSLILIGVSGIVFHIIDARSMLKLSKTITGFIIILPLSLIDVILLVQFGIWPGAVSLLKSRILPDETGKFQYLITGATW